MGTKEFRSYIIIGIVLLIILLIAYYKRKKIKEEKLRETQPREKILSKKKENSKDWSIEKINNILHETIASTHNVSEKRINELARWHNLESMNKEQRDEKINQLLYEWELYHYKMIEQNEQLILLEAVDLPSVSFMIFNKETRKMSFYSGDFQTGVYVDNINTMRVVQTGRYAMIIDTENFLLGEWRDIFKDEIDGIYPKD